MKETDTHTHKKKGRWLQNVVNAPFSLRGKKIITIINQGQNKTVKIKPATCCRESIRLQNKERSTQAPQPPPPPWQSEGQVGSAPPQSLLPASPAGCLSSDWVAGDCLNSDWLASDCLSSHWSAEAAGLSLGWLAKAAAWESWQGWAALPLGLLLLPPPPPLCGTGIHSRRSPPLLLKQRALALWRR